MKVVIWGYKLHTHTHSYIHHGYAKAFAYLGYEVLWFDDTDDVSNVDFSDTTFFFLTGEQHNVPEIKNAWYLVHNYSAGKLLNVRDKFIHIQVYNNKTTIGEHINPYTIRDLNTKSLFMPWATDLLPNEINENVDSPAIRSLFAGRETCWFVGTVYDSGGNNIKSKLERFNEACKKFSLDVKLPTPITLKWKGMYSGGENPTVLNEDAQKLIYNSFLAPVIQSDFQIEIGYVPCRIFKNISYGHYGITNNPLLKEIIHPDIVYEEDPYELFFKAKKFMFEDKGASLKNQMICIKKNHTYVSRIFTIWELIEAIGGKYKASLGNHIIETI